jgi:hypothetical protein
MNKIISFVALAVAIIAVGIAYTKTSAPVVVPTDGADLGAVYDRSSTQGGFKVGQGLVQGGITSITTATAAYTLTANDLKASVIDIPYSANALALTLTLPATTTMAKILPNDGDTGMWIIDNHHTAAATTTTIAGYDGDGVAGTDETINGGVSGRLVCWNTAAADTNYAFRCFVNEGIDAY